MKEIVYELTETKMCYNRFIIGGGFETTADMVDKTTGCEMFETYSPFVPNAKTPNKD